MHFNKAKEIENKITTPVAINSSKIKKPEHGKTVSALYAQKNILGGKEVIVRGKVIKFNKNIMGKNWIHIQDGTGDIGTNDLTITTSDMVEVNDIVVVTGRIATDRDFGFGYKYDIIIEDAKVLLE